MSKSEGKDTDKPSLSASSSDAYLRRLRLQTSCTTETCTSETSLLDSSFSSLGSSGRFSCDYLGSSSRCGSVFVEDPLTGKAVRKSHVLLLYTGGALGWKIDDEGIGLDRNLVLRELKKLPMMHDREYVDFIQANIKDDIPEEDIGLDQLVMPVSQENVRIFVDVLEMKESDVVVHSKDSHIKDWINIAAMIKEHYEKYHGFVILHGTDTMAYTASALSFMLENIGKCCIFTGSQVPLHEHLTDGRDNLLGAIMIAGHCFIPEVTLFFHGKLYRGNRAMKVDSRSFGAFDSPNFPPLAQLESGIEVEWDEVFQLNQTSKFTVHSKMNPNIGVMRLFPGIPTEAVKAFLEPPTEGAILETYGAGNGPDAREDLIQVISAAAARGVIIVNCTQCVYGQVEDSYATGRSLLNAGMIPGADMTVEAALAKLSYVLAHDELTVEKKKELMKTNLRGELTTYQKDQPEQFSLRNNELINAVASKLNVGSDEEVRFIKQALFPVLMCHASSQGDLEEMERLCVQGCYPNSAMDPEGRTPLHVASLEGNLEVARFLLLRGASPHVRDKHGQSPLDDAIRSMNEDVIKLLRVAGAHLGPTTMDLAQELCCSAADDRVDKLRAWYLAGVDFNVGDYDGRTALHVAVCRNNVHTVKFLLECGVDTSVTDLYGQTPLQNAQMLRNSDMIRFLELKITKAKTDTEQNF